MYVLEYIGVRSCIESFAACSLTFISDSGAPLNASLLWIRVTCAPIFCNSNVQSRALSPPPKITTLLSLNTSLFLIE